MKKLILTLLVACFLALSTTAQTPASIKDTVINKVSHKLYIGAKGGKYIIVTSKAGKTYKRYFKK